MLIGSLCVSVALIIWVSRSITNYSKLLLSHLILFRNKHILFRMRYDERHLPLFNFCAWNYNALIMFICTLF